MPDENTDNYAKQVIAARELFLKWDQKKLIRRTGIDIDTGFIYINFFEERYSVNRSSGEVMFCEKSAADYSAVMVIYDVLCNSKPDAALSGEWQSLEYLTPHSNFGSTDKSIFSQAAKAFSGRIDELKKACMNAGGIETKKGDAGFMFNAFPFLPVLFQFWDGDDEFEPRISFHFDKNTLDYIMFETAWFVAGYLIDKISAGMKEK